MKWKIVSPKKSGLDRSNNFQRRFFNVGLEHARCFQDSFTNTKQPGITETAKHMARNDGDS